MPAATDMTLCKATGTEARSVVKHLEASGAVAKTQRWIVSYRCRASTSRLVAHIRWVGKSKVQAIYA